MQLCSGALVLAAAALLCARADLPDCVVGHSALCAVLAELAPNFELVFETRFLSIFFKPRTRAEPIVPIAVALDRCNRRPAPSASSCPRFACNKKV